jgi:hypothetical protein
VYADINDVSEQQASHDWRQGGLQQVKFESLLIVTYGRSGSTLLQGLLNSIDGVFIKGENENFLYGIYLAYESLSKAHRTYADYNAAKATGAWYGINSMTPERFLMEVGRAVDNVLFSDAPPGTVCRGFKEVRYFQTVPPAQLHGYLNFLARFFPNPAFLINLRKHDDVLQSGWWRKHGSPESVRRNLGLFENSLDDWRKTHPERTHVIRYEDVISKGPTLLQMYDFLGVPFDEAKYNAVMATPHSYDQRLRSDAVDPKP